nr:hypothetical protein [Tanacetum cinerariifolium]
IVALKAEMVEINKNLIRVLQVNQQVKAVTSSCETCGGPHSFNDCLATVGNTQNVYATGAYQGIHTNHKVTAIFSVVAKVNSNSSTPAVSSDVAELKDIVRALLLDKKKQYSDQTPSPTHVLIKAGEPNRVTCDGSQSESKTSVFEPVVAPISASIPNLKPSIPYP